MNINITICWIFFRNKLIRSLFSAEFFEFLLFPLFAMFGEVWGICFWNWKICCGVWKNKKDWKKFEMIFNFSILGLDIFEYWWFVKLLELRNFTSWKLVKFSEKKFEEEKFKKNRFENIKQVEPEKIDDGEKFIKEKKTR